MARPVSFWGRLGETRELVGLSQAELARLCGVPRTYFGQVERLKTDVALSRAAAAAMVLGTSLDYLAFGVGGAPDADSVNRAVERARHDPQAIREAIARALGVGRKARKQEAAKTSEGSGAEGRVARPRRRQGRTAEARA